MLLQKLGYLYVIFAVFFLFSSCSLTDDNVDYMENEKDNIVEITIYNGNDSYLFICTNNYQIITYDESKNKRVVSECESSEIRYIDCFLNYIVEDDADNIEFNPGVNDFWLVNLQIDDQNYLFTYGASKNPYVNMLVELVIGCSGYKNAQEALVPYPSTFRW